MKKVIVYLFAYLIICIFAVLTLNHQLTVYVMTNKRLLILSVVSICSLGLAATAQDQTIQLTTTKNVGESMTIVTNNVPGGITVDWGDGTPVSYNTDTITGAVKGTTITIQGSSALTSLDCSGNALTKIQLSGAPNLESLDCSNNAMTSLALSGADNLEEIDCSGNQIKTLSLNSQTTPNIKRIFASNNEIASFRVTGSVALEAIDLSDNSLSSLSLTSFSDLSYLDCSNNKLRSLSINSSALSALVCSGNNLTSVSFRSASLSDLRDVVVSNNSLSTLDLSDAEAIHGIYCANNELEKVSLPMSLDGDAPTLDAYDCSNNKLNMTSMPPRTAVPDLINYAQQGPIDISDLLEPGVDGKMNFLLTSNSEDSGKKKIDLDDYTKDACGNSAATLRVYGYVDGAEQLLEKGTDYTMSGVGKDIEFKKPFEYVICRFEPRVAPYRDDFVTSTEPFGVYESRATGIDEVTASTSGLSVSVKGTSVTMSAPKSQAVRIYSAAGQLIWQGVVSNSGTTVQLEKGVYLIGDKKVAL